MNAWRWIALASFGVAGACGGAEEPTTASNAESNGSNTESNVARDDLIVSTCGGPDDVACPSGTYCATAKANQCPTDETTGRCRRIPYTCGEDDQPMCGCDGQTYGNACQAALAGVALAYEGKCAPFCGGFAGLPCPGAGECVDNATDSCDPAQGDVDCASLCQCNMNALCEEGAHWDSSPEVCACVWD